MFRHLAIALIALLSLAAVVRAQQPTTPSGDPVIHEARIKVAAAINLPAREAGVLVELPLKEGMQVRKDQQIGRIDDSEPQMQKRAAGYALNAAIKIANDDVNIRFSDKAAKASEADYLQLVEANDRFKGSVTETEVRAKKLEWEKTVLSIEKSKHDKDVATLEAYVKKAELDAAEQAIQRRVILAPCDGVIERIDRKQSEWCAPGDTILQLLPMDTMQVDGAVDQAEYDPHQIENCEVTVEVQMARGRTETFRGRITKVSAKVGHQDVFNVRAEIANRQEHGSWMLRDGLKAKMTIHLNTGGAAVTQAP